MGHRVTRALVVVVGLLLLAAPAAAQEPPPDTLLPPADDEDITIVPTDRPEQPSSEVPTSDPSRATDDADGAGPDGPAAALVVVLALGITALASARLARMLYAWRSPLSLAAAGFGPATIAPTISFTLLVPARHSGKRLGPTLDGLATLDHPDFEVLVVVPYGDAEARGSTLAAVVRHPNRIHMVVDKSFRKTRAAGLNAGLAQARGEVVGIVEPGDRLHPRLLHHVDGCFADPDVAAVQGGVQLGAEVGGRRWFGARNAVERYFWSRSRLHLHASQRFTPLESTTAFVRTATLRADGGWDETCTAEGCELGVRLSTQGRRIVVAYSPELATTKPAVASTRALLAERARWIGGFVQVLRKGYWRRLPGRAQRARAALALARPLLDAVTGLAVPLAVAAALVLPLRPAFVLLLLLPAVPALVALGVEAVALAELGRIHDRPTRRRDHAWLVVSWVPYQLLGAVAATLAVVGVIRPRRQRVPVAVARSGRERLRNLNRMNEVDLTTPHRFDHGYGYDAGGGLERPALPAAAGDR